MYVALGWDVLVVNNDKVSEIDKAIDTAKKSGLPSLIIVNTVIGKYSQFENTNKIHGKLSSDDLEQIRNKIKGNPPFVIDEDNFAALRKKVKTRTDKAYSDWYEDYKSYIEKILVSLNNYISVVSPGSVQEYRKISKFVLQFMHQSTKQANAFVETRLPEIEELEKKQEQKRENRQLRKLELATEIKDFQTLINKMFRNIKNNPSDAIKLLEIQKYYEENPKKRGDLMEAAGEGKDALIRYFDTQISNTSNHIASAYSFASLSLLILLLLILPLYLKSSLLIVSS